MPALGGQFVWDDTLLIDRNPLVTGLLGFKSLWFHTDFPLSILAFRLQQLLWGKNAFGYHLVNITLHAANGFLIWRTLALLRIPGARFSALLFLIHPVCVMSVAWVSELKNTLSLFFYLLSLNGYLRSEITQPTKVAPGRIADSQPFEIKWYVLSFCAFTLALLGKTSTVMLPATLLLCIWWQHDHIKMRQIARTIPFFVLAGCFAALTIWFQKHQAMADIAVRSENFWERLANAGTSLWFYLAKGLLPIKLCAIYPGWEIPTESLICYFPVVLWGIIIFTVWFFRKTFGRAFLFGLGFFVVNLFPVLGFFDMYFFSISRVSDHLQYIPLIGIISLGGSILSRIIFRKSQQLVACLLIAALSVLACRRAWIFATDERLWRDTLAKNPSAWLAHNNLGSLLAEQHKLGEAREHFVAALKLRPFDARAHCNLGGILAEEGDNAGAEKQYSAAIESKPKDGEIRSVYGAFLVKEGKMEEAIEQLKRAVELEPIMIDARLRLADLMYQAGDYWQTAEEYRQVLGKKPGSMQAMSNLAWLLSTCPDAKVRNGAEAVRWAKLLCQMTNYREAHCLGVLAAAYAEAAEYRRAATTAERAIEVARAEGDSGFAEQNRRLLKLYQAQKPYHEPARRSQEQL